MTLACIEVAGVALLGNAHVCSLAVPVSMVHDAGVGHAFMNRYTDFAKEKRKGAAPDLASPMVAPAN